MFSCHEKFLRKGVVAPHLFALPLVHRNYPPWRRKLARSKGNVTLVMGLGQLAIAASSALRDSKNFKTRPHGRIESFEAGFSSVV